MSTNKTQNYNLHSWVPEDDFIRSEFNDNFAGIDAALKTLSDGIAAEATARTAAVNAEKTAREQAVAAEATARASAVTAEENARKQAVTAEATARQQAVTAEQNARVAAINSLTASKAELVFGTYTGNGQADQSITLGFQPRAVLIVNMVGRTATDNYQCGGLLLPQHPICVYGNTDIALAEITSTGFYVRSSINDARQALNNKNIIYYYIAVK